MENTIACQRALDEGITYYDTAPSCSDGQSEQRLGRALAGMKVMALGRLSFYF